MSTENLPAKKQDSFITSASSIEPVVSGIKQLSTREINQIMVGFSSQSYEMVSSFVLNKTTIILKKKLSTLGMDFIGEMLGRQDIDEFSSPDELTNHDAIRLAHELGMITGTMAMRLKRSLDTVNHFANLEESEAETEIMNEEEAKLCLIAATQAVLGQPKIELPVEFMKFREKISYETFKEDSPEVESLVSSPYFYKKTALSVLMSKIKTSKGAGLGHAVGNISIILPLMWTELRKIEKWQVGETYRNVYSDGNQVATLGLKKVLIKVNGFDFVPESLRSHSFSRAASNVLTAHDGINNFYNEVKPMAALANMGTTIPYPAFPICLTATLSVYLGNSYGQSWDSQEFVNKVLDRLSSNQWEYYLNECISKDTRILEKICWHNKPQSRWFELVEKYSLSEYRPNDPLISKLLEASNKKKAGALQGISEALIEKMSE